MAVQIKQPVSDISTGNWTTSPLWSKIDEGTTPDGTYIIHPNNSNSTCEVAIDNPIIDESYHAIQLEVYARKSAAAGNARGLDADIRIDGSLVGAKTFTAALTENWTKYTLIFNGEWTKAQMETLQVQLISTGATGGSAGNKRQVWVDYLQVYFVTGTEDFTTYTETDPNSHITVVDANTITFSGLLRNEDSYVYSDKGVGHFAGDFEHLVEGTISGGSSANAIVFFWSLSNSINDWVGITDELGLMYVYSSASGYYLGLREKSSSSEYSDYTAIPFKTLSTVVYAKIVRDEAVGANGTLYVYLYNDAARTDLADTLTVTLHSKQDLRYMYAIQTYNDNTGVSANGQVENLDLQEITSQNYTQSALENPTLHETFSKRVSFKQQKTDTTTMNESFSKRVRFNISARER